MLSGITLENFKSFKKLDNMEIKPITILCGTNSCGKSSILESILLLKQTLESRNPNQTILLNGRFVHLGSLENIIYGRKLENDVVLNYQFNINRSYFFNRSKNKPPLLFVIRNLVSRESRRNPKAEYIINYKISLGNQHKLNSNNYNKQIIVKELIISVETKVEDKIIPEIKIELKLQSEMDELYEITWENIKSRFIDSDNEYIEDGSKKNIKVIFENLFPGEINFQCDKDGDMDLPVDIIFVFRKLNNILQRIVNSYTYLGPLREEPSRRYIYEDEVVEMGVKGENAAYLYLSEQDNLLKNHYFYDEKQDAFYEEKKTIKLGKALSKWLDLMNINEFKPELNNGIIYLKLNSQSSEGTQVNIADVGFGVSQIFPILLEGLRMERGNCLLLEQPEIHLHPNLQMQMADYFISLALSGKKVIVETHSDHIINRLVRRIVEDERLNLNKLIGMYFIDSTPNGSVYKKIKVDDTRGIIDWPKDFFDQTSTEQEKIMIAGLKKRKMNRIYRGDIL